METKGDRVELAIRDLGLIATEFNKYLGLTLISNCLTLAGGYGLEGSNLLFNFTAFTFRALEFFLLIFRNFHDPGKGLFTFFTNEFVCRHCTPPFSYKVL